MKTIFITGAGISAELGLETYSDKNSENKPEKHLSTLNTLEDIWNYLSPLYEQIDSIKLPEYHGSHYEIVDFCKFGNVTVLTQNIDGFHLKKKHDYIFEKNPEYIYNVIELHGTHSFIKCNYCVKYYEWKGSIKCIKCGITCRPDIVLYGEAVRLLDEAKSRCKNVDLCVIIGTSFKFGYLRDFAVRVKQRGGYVININLSKSLDIADTNLKLSSLEGLLLIKDIIDKYMPMSRKDWKNCFMDMQIYS